MINERTTEKYSAIYYGIIREGVKKMIRARISQTQKEFKEGKGFYFETEVKEIEINKKVSNLNEISFFGITSEIKKANSKGNTYENSKK